MEASEAAKVKGALYEKYFIRRQYDGLDLEAALDLYASFHILEALQVRESGVTITCSSVTAKQVSTC